MTQTTAVPSPGANLVRIGELEVLVLQDGASRLPGHFYGEHGGDHGEEIDADNIMTLPIAAFLVRTGGHTVLIDAGLGPVRYEFTTSDGQPMMLYGGELPRRLAEQGLTPADIDYVIPTHLHADHAGWVVQNAQAYFPNATVRFGREDWEENVTHSKIPPFADGMRALADAGRIDPIDGDGEILPGITALHTPGHTAGHTSFVLSSAGQRAIILGDIVSCPMQVRNAEMEVVFDTDPALAVRTRERVLREIDGDMLVGGPHFPGLRFGRLLVGEGRRYWS